ncbi:MAG: LysR family transcriptional regulator [Proteobacteria bacterium]|nr:LysR family transcriptional regulator [Pseudomonadota bacterium]
MNFWHLRGFLEVRARGSISAAANAMGTSQPALTQGIAKLEHQLEHKLFERRARGLIITPVGETVALRVRAALDHLAQGLHAASGKMLDPARRLSHAQVRAFLALVETGSFGRAGVATGMAAASIHRAVRALEDVVGCPLAERRGRAVAVNLYGRRLARDSRLALAELETVFTELGLQGGELTIVVGTTPLARAFLVPEAMATMSAQGGARFRVLEGSWAELAEALREGLADILVGEVPQDVHPELELQVLHDAPIVIVAGHDHPLVGRRPDIAMLASFPWIVAPRGTPLRDAWERLFCESPPQSLVECGSIMIIGRLLTSSNQLTLVTPDQVALQIRSGLLARVDSTTETGRITIGATLRRGWRPPAAHARFLALLSEITVGLDSQRMRRSLVERRWV